MLGHGWFLHAGSLDCLTFQFADKPAAHLPDPATINGHSMIAQHRSQWAHTRHRMQRSINQMRTKLSDTPGPFLPFTLGSSSCGAARRRRHSLRLRNRVIGEFTVCGQSGHQFFALGLRINASRLQHAHRCVADRVANSAI